MNTKLRVGILMGGSSREREISFAGGRTVYDNLNRAFFEPVPIFVDSLGNFFLINWQFLYKGTIRDFFPPHALYPSPHFSYYQEQIPRPFAPNDYEPIGTYIPHSELKNHIDFAFLTLHGLKGEDGSLQGLLEWFNIPYSGTGVLGSAIGIDKTVQKKLQQAMGYELLPFLLWDTSKPFPTFQVQQQIGFPFVLKNPLQGSSIGTAIVPTLNHIHPAIQKVALSKVLSLKEWRALSTTQKIQYLNDLNDLKNGFSFPLYADQHLVQNPDELLNLLEQWNEDFIEIKALDAPPLLLIEKFIEGTEFSVIVIQDEQGKPIALPPTEIRKNAPVFDYDSKYLPGKVSKLTPIDLPLETILLITQQAEKLMQDFHFNVYARIDGFITSDRRVYFNDPNTTSGMLPSSFFFHQAATIGWAPSHFLTYILYLSCLARKTEGRIPHLDALLQRLRSYLNAENQATHPKERIAVILGGYSEERHISVESGRNIVEKLQASGKYHVTPLFLKRSAESPHGFELYEIPLDLLFKDNADDIALAIEKALTNPTPHPYVQHVIQRIEQANHYFSHRNQTVRHYPVTTLSEHFDFVFIAIHGRPGEDGQLQTILEAQHLPYNGSRPLPAEIAMDKYRCNELLRQHGVNVAPHFLVHQQDYLQNPVQTLQQIEQALSYPMIAKPNDEGCSAGVQKIQDRQALQTYLKQIFAMSGTSDASTTQTIPSKTECLLENFISGSPEYRLMEITVGFLTHWQDHELVYEVFPPSETLRAKEILSLEEKFLAGQGMNITPARFAQDPSENQRIEKIVQQEITKAAKIIGLTGYARIDAFVKIFEDGKVEVWIIEANTLPGMTPATCIFHQAALHHYTPLHFIEKIIAFGKTAPHEKQFSKKS